jgi:hypothetical protein
MYYSFLADIIVVIHLAYACFVLLGFLAIVVGSICGWFLVRNFPFRVIHLVCTVLVPLETLIRITCPLTTLENLFLRASGAKGYERSFIGNFINEILFYDAPEWVFAIIYTALATLVVLYFILYPPIFPPRNQVPIRLFSFFRRAAKGLFN